MADQVKIDLVKINLPSWRQEITTWNDTKIGQMLDTVSGNVSKTVRLFWLERVNNTSALTDIADVGASRPLSQTYQHAQDMLRYWDKIAGEGSTASSVGKIKRRYQRHPQPPYGLTPYGGVYARTD